MEIRTRTLFYSFLTLACYSLASIITIAWSTVTFLVVGGAAELFFWMSLKPENKANKN